MQLEKTAVRIRCEMGACKERADYTIRLARVGIRSRIHICGTCLVQMGECIKEATAETKPETAKPPKSVETLKPKRKE